MRQTVRFTARLLVLLATALIVPRPAVALDTYTVKSEELARESVFDAVLEAVNQSTVAAQTSARVEAIAFDVGDYVEKGAVIIRFRATEQQARLDSAQAAVRETTARLADAETNFQRVRDVHGRGLLPRSELDKAEADLKAARARVEAARAAADAEQEGVEHTLVRSPYAGIVVQRHIEVGETATPGRPLMTGVSLEHLRAAVDIPQSAIAPMREHGNARVVLPDGSSLTAGALRIPPNADPQTHTFRVLVSLPEGEHGVFPGMLVKVAFTSGTGPGLLAPPAAIVQRSEVTAVYVVDAQDRITFRYVRIGTPAPDGRIPILSGLQVGERIALDPIAAGVEQKGQAAP